MGDQNYRTCLDCLGQGQIPSEPSELHEVQGVMRQVSVSASR
jgi:hypothetical protein